MKPKPKQAITDTLSAEPTISWEVVANDCPDILATITWSEMNEEPVIEIEFNQRWKQSDLKALIEFAEFAYKDMK